MKVARLISEESIMVFEYETRMKEIELIYQHSIKTLGLQDDVINLIKSKDKNDWTGKESSLITARLNVDNKYKKSLDELASLKEYVSQPPPVVGELDDVIPYYIDERYKISQLWKVTVNSKQKINDKIKKLKKELSDSDFKVIKFQERFLSITDNPMTPEELEAQKQLSADRQSIRDEINRLQKLL